MARLGGIALALRKDALFLVGSLGDRPLERLGRKSPGASSIGRGMTDPSNDPGRKSPGASSIGRGTARSPDGLPKVALFFAIRSAAIGLRFLVKRVSKNMARLGGIEPPLPAPEAGALSPELQAPFDIVRRPVPPEGSRWPGVASQKVG